MAATVTDPRLAQARKLTRVLTRRHAELHVLAAKRRALIADLRADGVPTRAIATFTGLTPANVRLIATRANTPKEST